MPSSAIKVASGSNGTFFYRVGNYSIKILEDNYTIPEKIYISQECCACMDSECEIVLVDCGHLCLCQDCSEVYNSNECPLCRSNIKAKIHKDKLQ